LEQEEHEELENVYKQQGLHPEDEEEEYEEEDSPNYQENFEMYKQAFGNIGREAPVNTGYSKSEEERTQEQRESEQQEFEGQEEYDEEDILRMQYQLQQLGQGEYEEDEQEEFEKIQIQQRSKSDGELLDRRFEGDYDDMEDSDQVSLHDDGEAYLGEHQDYGRGGYGMHKPQGFGIHMVYLVFL